MNEKELCDRVLGILREQGAEGDAFIERRRSLTLRVREGRVEEVQRAAVNGLAVRAMKDGRLGFTHTSNLDPELVARTARKACELARNASPRDDLVLADPAGPGTGEDEGAALGIYDPEIEAKSTEEKQDWIHRVEKAALAHDPKIRRSDGAAWKEELFSIWIANTKGLFRHYRKSHVDVGVSVIAEDAGELQAGEYEVDVTGIRDLFDPTELGRTAGERAVRLLGGRPVETGKYPVVFSPDTGWTLLVYLSVALNGSHLSKRRSWLSEQLAAGGEVKVGSPLVTLIDSGRRPGGVGTVPFDGEGVDSRDQTLVENGIVKGRLCDLASAKSLGIPPTGNAGRGGYEGTPQIFPHNNYLVPGAATVEQLLAPIEKGLWLWGLSGWWIGLDPSNPNLSSAAVGLWIEDGKPVRPVARVSVAGGLTEILGNIEEVGSDLVWDRPTKTPSFRVREMAVSGA